MISPVSGLKAADLGSSSSSLSLPSADDIDPGSDTDEETDDESSSSSTIDGAGSVAPVAETAGGVDLAELEEDLLLLPRTSLTVSFASSSFCLITPGALLSA